MGLAVLPARLKGEMARLSQAMLSGSRIEDDPELSKHAAWARQIAEKHPDLNAGNIDGIIKQEIGEVFMNVLTDAGVFKRTAEGAAAFERFAAQV